MRRGRTFLAGGRVVDVERGVVLPAGTVVVLEGERIAAVLGPNEGIGVGAEDRVLELAGRTLIPGMLNTHCHLELVLPHMTTGLRGIWAAHFSAFRQREKTMRECIARGVTGVRDAWAEDLRLVTGLASRIERGELLGPTLYPSVIVSQAGGPFASRRTLAEHAASLALGVPLVRFASRNSGVVVFARDASAKEVRGAVDRAIDRGAHTIKIYEQSQKKLTYRPGATLMTMAQLEALADQARRRGVPSTMHHASAESLRRGVRAGVTSLAHTHVEGELADEDVRAFVAAGCVLEPTLSLVYDLFAPKKGDLAWEHPRARELTALRKASYETLANTYLVPSLARAACAGFRRQERGHRRLAGLFDMSHVYDFFTPLLHRGLDAAWRIAREGGLLACGNDAGAVARTAAMVELELVMLDFCLRLGSSGSTSGLDGATALRFVTQNAAKAMGESSRLGTISAGKIADLVVYDEDVLTNWRLLGRPAAAVFKRGELCAGGEGL